MHLPGEGGSPSQTLLISWGRELFSSVYCFLSGEWGRERERAGERERGRERGGERERERERNTVPWLSCETCSPSEDICLDCWVLIGCFHHGKLKRVGCFNKQKKQELNSSTLPLNLTEKAGGVEIPLMESSTCQTTSQQRPHPEIDWPKRKHFFLFLSFSFSVVIIWSKRA